MARLHHPHIVQVFGMGEDPLGPYLAMELLEGGSLAALLARVGPLEPPEAIAVVLPVIAAMTCSHDMQMIHRDIKPSNIVFASSSGPSWPKLLDFGLSKVIGVDVSTEDLTASDAAVGTAAYMAPEQARAARDASFLSDEYSLGVLLYQCVTGRLPFSGNGVYDLLQAIMTKPVLAPSLLVPAVSPELDAIILRAMSREPRHRFESLRALGRALVALASAQIRSRWETEFCPTSSIGSVTASIPESGAAGSVSTTIVTAEVRLPRFRFTRIRAVAASASVALVALMAPRLFHHSINGAAQSPERLGSVVSSSGLATNAPSIASRSAAVQADDVAVHRGASNTTALRSAQNTLPRPSAPIRIATVVSPRRPPIAKPVASATIRVREHDAPILP
jgi:serine/threonine protein kinase